MTEELITMDDMQAIFEIIDLFEIDRETISVPLEKGLSGSVFALDDGSIEIVVPIGIPIREWLPELQAGIEGLGFSVSDEGGDW